MDNLLTITTFTPLLAALIMGFLLKGHDAPAVLNARYLALYGTLATLFVALFIVAEFDPGTADFQFVEERDWAFGLAYRVGLDGISALFVLVTAVTMPFVVWASWRVKTHVKELMIGLLALETTLIGAFCALDIVQFFAFSEAAFVLVVIMIGVWGGAHGPRAGIKLALYTLMGSGFMLAAILTLSNAAATADITKLLIHNFNADPRVVLGWSVPGGLQTLVMIALLISVAVKSAIWPYHAWTPLAFHQAPTALAFVATALVLKLGIYGLVRIALPMLPVAVDVVSPAAFWIAGIGIVYLLLVALVQRNIRQTITYALAAHMGLVVLGLFSMTQQGVDGAIFHAVAAGVIFSALFFCAGVIHDRDEVCDFETLGGLFQRMPLFASLFMIFVMGMMLMPGTMGFPGAMLAAVGALQVQTWAVLVALAGVPVLAACAMGLYRRVMLGELMRGSLKSIADLDRREGLVLGAMAGLVIGLGLVPAVILDFIGVTVGHLVDTHAANLAAARGS